MNPQLIAALGQLSLAGATGQMKGERLAEAERRLQQEAQEKRKLAQALKAAELRRGAGSLEELQAVEGLLAHLEGRAARHDAMRPTPEMEQILVPSQRHGDIAQMMGAVDEELPELGPPTGTSDRFAIRHMVGGAPEPQWQELATVPTGETLEPADPLAGLLYRQELERKAEAARKAKLAERGRAVDEGRLRVAEAKEERYAKAGHPWPPQKRQRWSPSFGLRARRDELDRAEDILRDAERDVDLGVPGADERYVEARINVDRLRRGPSATRITPEAGKAAAKKRASRASLDREAKALDRRQKALKTSEAEDATLAELRKEADDKKAVWQKYVTEYGPNNKRTKAARQEWQDAIEARKAGVGELESVKMSKVRPSLDRLFTALSDPKLDPEKWPPERIAKFVQSINAEIRQFGASIEATTVFDLLSEVNRVRSLMPGG